MPSPFPEVGFCAGRCGREPAESRSISGGNQNRWRSEKPIHLSDGTVVAHSRQGEQAGAASGNLSGIGILHGT